MSPTNTSRASTFQSYRLGRRAYLRVALTLLLVLSFPTNQASEVKLSSDVPAVGTSSPIPTPSSLVKKLLSALQSDNRSFPPAIEKLLADGNQTSRKDANWPTLNYLLGEAYLQQNKTQRARAAFREIVMWAISDYPEGPYGDTWGGSGLAIVGLWRWLQILDEHGAIDPKEIDQVLESAEQLQDTRIFSGMVAGGFLPALPLVEEAIARLLAHVAWTNKRPEAAALFLHFLAIDSTGKPDEIDEEMRKALLAKGLWNENRLDLFRARRMLRLVQTKEQKDKAAETLKKLLEKQQVPPDVRAEAGYQWANYKRNQRNKQELITVLTQVIKLAGDQPVAQKALFRRGTIHNKRHSRRNPLSDQEVNAFRDDMLELIHRFPGGSLHDNALHQLATHYFFKPDVDLALKYFEKLRHLKSSNEFQDSAYYYPALALVGRGREADLNAADELLEKYELQYPDGVFHIRCLFWRGRIAEQKKDPVRAKEIFDKLIKKAPYDYYALRANMHVLEGTAAINQDLPGTDSQTRRDLHKSYSKSQVDVDLIADSPYHERLRTAANSGLYKQLLAINQGLGKRLDHIPLDQLNQVSAAALLLALRQDALAAKDSDLQADNLLRLAGLLGRKAGDWPTAIEMTLLRSNGPQQRLTDLQRDSRYLATAYPRLAELINMKHPLASAAWPIDGSDELSQNLMYGVIRQESQFYARAISKKGALGLFQFMPSTFRGIIKNHGWNLLEDASVDTDVEYLLDPQRNAALWARWVNKEFPLKHRNGIAMALMKHQAGSGHVSDWNHYWEKLNAGEDLEFRIETARFYATGKFVRHVLRDTTIIDAASLRLGEIHQ